MGVKMPGFFREFIGCARDQTQRYVRDTAAATAIAFALIIPVVVGSAGMAVDVATAYLVQQRLSHALDAAALAAAASASGEDDMQGVVDQFMEKNYPPEELGATYNIQVTQVGNDIKLSGYASFDTFFIQILGIDVVEVSADTTVAREILGLEVVMVLDVTGSMSTNNNIGALRTAASNFTNILMNSAVYEDSVKIGLVPFATTVNVGPYGLGKTPSNTTYDTAFVNNPSNRKFNQSKSTDWWGCILERAYPQDTQDAQPSWRWEMYRYSTSAPNQNCNKAYILPLTTSRSTILNRINGLTASGNTLSNVGMVWGYRVISPDFPFREGTEFNDPEVRKAVLLMTDGDNNIGNTYSAYGPWSTYRLTDEDLNDRLAETCENMKDEGISIYTVTFTSNIDQHTKDFFKECATTPDKWFNAPSQADLIEVFEFISRELANIHIRE